MDTTLGSHIVRIRQNRLLHAIYQDVYRRIAAELTGRQFLDILEIGSGGGFIRDHLPQVTTSDCIAGPNIDCVLDACNLTERFGPSCLDAIVAFNVFHHLPDPVGFLRSANTVLRAGGKIVLVEPWFTPVGQWFYRAIHHEPVIMDPNDWRIEGHGRLQGANSRLPTSVFREGRQRMALIAPELTVTKCEPFHKWLYLVSGGLKLNTRVPPAVARLLLRADRATAWLDRYFGIFALIVAQKAA